MHGGREYVLQRTGEVWSFDAAEPVALSIPVNKNGELQPPAGLQLQQDVIIDTLAGTGQEGYGGDGASDRLLPDTPPQAGKSENGVFHCWALRAARGWPSPGQSRKRSLQLGESNLRIKVPPTVLPTSVAECRRVIGPSRPLWDPTPLGAAKVTRESVNYGESRRSTGLIAPCPSTIERSQVGSPHVGHAREYPPGIDNRILRQALCGTGSPTDFQSAPVKPLRWVDRSLAAKRSRRCRPRYRTATRWDRCAASRGVASPRLQDVFASLWLPTLGAESGRSSPHWQPGVARSTHRGRFWSREASACGRLASQDVAMYPTVAHLRLSMSTEDRSLPAAGNCTPEKSRATAVDRRAVQTYAVHEPDAVECGASGAGNAGRQHVGRADQGLKGGRAGLGCPRKRG